MVDNLITEAGLVGALDIAADHFDENGLSDLSHEIRCFIGDRHRDYTQWNSFLALHWQAEKLSTDPTDPAALRSIP